MKQLLNLTILCVFLNSCSFEKKEEKAQKVGKSYFDYDKIEYYFNDFDESKEKELWGKENKSAIDSLKMSLLSGNTPKNLNDLSFLEKIQDAEYELKTFDKTNYKVIDEIFVEKKTISSALASCMPLYRDILVFKKGGQIVGVAKICFGCMMYHIIGTTANTENFGQDGDYIKLEKLLHGKNDPYGLPSLIQKDHN